jgi:hypothetical protein
MYGNFLVIVTKFYQISRPDKIVLLEGAADVDPCNGDILNQLGDAYLSETNTTMAAITYGRAMACSPASSLMRFKFGETLLMMNFIEGRQNVLESVTLEPRSPVYRQEMDRLTALQ